MNNHNDPVIAFDGVCFAYGSNEVLHNVTFTVPPRSLVAVVGPNGGGKTTLLRLTLGLELPRFGTVRVMGRSPKAARLSIGYVPQALAYDNRFPVSVEDVVLMGTLDRRWSAAYGRLERNAAADALSRVGLDGFAPRNFSDLSGGERQRVLIAQALAGNPRVLLLDEPTANVDPPTAEQLHELFRQLANSLTLLFVSHNLSVVTANATHVLCVSRTASLHTIAEMADGTFETAYGSDRMALLRHGATCQVVDSSQVLTSPHACCLANHNSRETP
ncbi:MAG: ATP-binding cassette domain-containing protein [Lentisphaerae bacterium]|jgi:zinc transport system ATP-binding protein|nr:ATP-binding cassette domain-containing protein [Lentisphaerota bacterium]